MTAVYVGVAFALSVLLGIMSVSDRETVQGAALGIFWGAILGISLYRRERQRRDGAWWAQVILVALLSRVLIAIVHLVVGLKFYGGAVDFTGYHIHALNTGWGILTADLSSVRGIRLTDQVLQLLLGLFYILTGPGIFGIFLMAGGISFIGSYLFLGAFRTICVNAPDERFLAMSLFFLPSIAFWSSLLGKECWIFFFLGLTSYFFARAMREIRFRHLLGMLVGLGAVTLVRPPVGVVTIVAMGTVWWFRPARGPAAILRPIATLVILVPVVVGAAGISAYYLKQEFSEAASGIVVRAAVVEEGFASDEDAAGSKLAARFTGDASFEKILRVLPEGFMDVFFYPSQFKARHLPGVAAIGESILVVGLILWRRRNLIMAVRMAFKKPFIGFCIGMLLLLGVMITFERNFGAMVRHRTMALPFLMILLAVPIERNAGRSRVRSEVTA